MKFNQRLLIVGAGVILGLLVLGIGTAHKQPHVVLSDGRVVTIEKVTFGTYHVVGWNDWWMVPLRKFLPGSVEQLLTPTKGQSRQSTERPALVVWFYAQDARGKYVDCQNLRVSFFDENGDVYPPKDAANGAFAKGFSREARTFYVFPRRSPQLRLQISPVRSAETVSLFIPNPDPEHRTVDWMPEAVPSTRRIGALELTLESMVLHTNGEPLGWEPLSVHWQPKFSLTADGKPASNWEAPEWEAEDPAGNRGQTLGRHEPIQKIIATLYPKPEAVTEKANCWHLPIAALPSAPQSIQWNTNRMLKDLSITVVGLFPPGSYTFTQGQLTNSTGTGSRMKGWTGLGKQILPGRWQWWHTYGATAYMAFIRRPSVKSQQRIAVGLTFKTNKENKVIWGRQDAGDEITAFVFDGLPDDAEEFGLDVVLLEPLRTEFVVKP